MKIYGICGTSMFFKINGLVWECCGHIRKPRDYKMTCIVHQEIRNDGIRPFPDYFETGDTRFYHDGRNLPSIEDQKKIYAAYLELVRESWDYPWNEKRKPEQIDRRQEAEDMLASLG